MTTNTRDLLTRLGQPRDYVDGLSDIDAERLLEALSKNKKLDSTVQDIKQKSIIAFLKKIFNALRVAETIEWTTYKVEWAIEKIKLKEFVNYSVEVIGDLVEVIGDLTDWID